MLCPTYAVVALHAAMPAHPPGLDVGVGVGVVPPDVGVGVGVEEVVLLANWAIILVKSQELCVTLLHVPESAPLLSGGLHSRSRLTDQNV